MTSHHTANEKAADKAPIRQKALDVVNDWASQTCMEISVEKTEATVFSLDPRETAGKCKPDITLNNLKVHNNKNPKILGEHYAPQCSFNFNAEQAVKNMKSRTQIIQCLAEKWGMKLQISAMSTTHM